MNHQFAFVVLVTVGTLLNCSQSHLTHRHAGRRRNANGEIFNLLLGLYKLNPLKGSQVYKAFSDHMLQGGEKTYPVFNVNSDETVKEKVKTNLKEIERMIHLPSKKSTKTFQKPEYDIDDVDIENFTVDIVLNDNFSKQQIKRTLRDNVDDLDNISSIFGHIGSNELDDDRHITKILPIKDQIIGNAELTDQTEAIFNFIEDYKGKSGNGIGSLIEVRGEVPEVIPIVKKVDATADVLVL